MSVISCISFLICVLFVINSVSSTPISEKGGEEPKEPSDSDDGESSVKDKGTVAPEEIDKLKEEIIKTQEEEAEKFDLDFTVAPDDVETLLHEKEKEVGEDLPALVEEELLDKDVDFKDFPHFHALFVVAVIEKEHVVKTPEEMKEMKEEVFRLVNEWSKWKKFSELSRKHFDEIWNKKEKEYGEQFPGIVQKLLLLLKEIEKNELIAESTTEELSEPVTVNSTQPADTIEEKPLKDAFILRNAKGNICILAKFESHFTITFPGKSSPETKVDVTIPADSHHTKGKCKGPNGSALLQITWGKFIFSLYFNKTNEDTWSVTLVELTYDTSEPVFDGAAERKKVTLKSKQESLFETPFGKSYSCPTEKPIILYQEDKHVATLRLKAIRLQAYDVEDGKFSTPHHCNLVVIGGLDEEPFVQDETVPLAVGCTLALITLLILVGFSVHRAYNAAKVDYNTVE